MDIISELKAPPKSKSITRNMEFFANTKAMKTCTRNWVQKIARLRARLVKIAEHDFFNACERTIYYSTHYESFYNFKFVNILNKYNCIIKYKAKLFSLNFMQL